MSKHRKILLSIPTDAVGLLIGKEGKTFNEISVQSSAKLTLQLHHDIARGSRERYIAIEGDIDKIARACRIIVEKLSSRNFAKGGEDQIELIKWVISQSRCSMIIGRNGSGIKAINAASGSWVKIAHVEEACPGESQRLLYIRGTKAQNDIALAMVKQIAGGHPLETPIDSPKAQLESVAAATNMVDFTLPGHLIREVLNAAEDTVDIQIDPEFDVFMGKEVKVRLIGRRPGNILGVKQSLLAHAEAVKASASTHIDDGKILDESTMREPFMALKMLVTNDDNALLTDTPNRDGIVVRDLLFGMYGISIILLPSSVRYSQTMELRQLVTVAPQHTFMTKLEDILVYLTSEQDYIQMLSANVRRVPNTRSQVQNQNVPNRYDIGNQENVRRGMEYEGQYNSHNINMNNNSSNNNSNIMNNSGGSINVGGGGNVGVGISSSGGGGGYGQHHHIQQIHGAIPIHTQQVPTYSYYSTSPPTISHSPPSYIMSNYGIPQQSQLPPGQFMSYDTTSFNDNGTTTYLSMSPPSPPPPSQRYGNSNSYGSNTITGYDSHGSPLQHGKASPLMNISYVSSTGPGMGIQTFGLDTAQVLPIITNGSYTYLPPPMPPLSPQMSGSFFTGEYGIMYSPPNSPPRSARRKTVSRGYRPDTIRPDLRSRSSSNDSMSGSLDSFYQNLTSESLDQGDNPDVSISQSILVDNPSVEPRITSEKTS